MSDIEPLPCPFCGLPASVCRDDEDVWSVECGQHDCNVICATARRDTRAAAIAAWNRRATPTPDPSPLTPGD